MSPRPSSLHLEGEVPAAKHRPEPRCIASVARCWLLGIVILGAALSCKTQLDNFAPGDDDTSGETDSTDDPRDAGHDAVDSGSPDGGPNDVPDTGPLPPHCSNNELDEDESAVDCGGDSCPKCGVRQVCSKNSDCESGLCNGTCLPRGCMNGIKDGSETDVDCGGSCDACDDGAACMVGAHCESKVCTDGFCLAATCEDDVRNAAETDVDCGGDDCETCEDGDSCDTDGDCKSGFCGDGTCADPACGDGSKNGDESDTDCGGSCPPCAADRVCRANSDCASNNCNEETRLCIAATCDDEIANGDESDEDCGGPCQPCPDGSTCNAAADCVSSVCQPPEVQAEADAGVAEVDLLQCAEPTCEDEVRNGSETGIDCGGSSCDPCGLDAPCSTDSDCASNYCIGVCIEATCSDDYLNQDETDVDCGGDMCVGCGADGACDGNDDCLSADCAAGVCQPSAASKACVSDADCITARCSEDNSCEPGYGGSGCYDDNDCVSSCSDGTCVPGATGEACENDNQCHSDHCRANGTCGKGGVGTLCNGDLNCVSNTCTSGVCQATRLSVRTDGHDASAVVSLQMWIQATPGEPALPWPDLAFLYFFRPELHTDFSFTQYNAAGTGPMSAYQLTADEWMFAWRSNATSAVSSNGETFVDAVLTNEGGGSYIHSNDYSYAPGGDPNPRIVVCQNTEGRWKHVQGAEPDWAPDPCRYIVDDCEDASSLDCDPL